MNIKKILYFCTIFVVFCEPKLKHFKVNSEISSIATAFFEVVSKFLIDNQIRFDVAIIDNASSDWSEIVSHFKDQISYKFFAWHPQEDYVLIESIIFFVSSCDDYVLVHTHIKLLIHFPKVLKILFYIENCSFHFIQNNLEMLIPTSKLTPAPSRLEVYEFHLINDGNFLHLTTIEWFTEIACNQPQLKILNHFNKITQKWNKKLENYEKFQDFHDCELKLWIFNDISGAYWSRSVFDSKNNEYRVSGLIPDFFWTVSENFNYKPKFQDDPNEAEVCFEIYRIENFGDSLLHMTSTFVEIQDLILATPGELYSPYEKLWLPFDDTTWTLLLLTFLIAFVAIFIINRFPRHIRILIYGENIQTPALNVVSTFFGISQLKVPVKTFSRFLLLLFVMFCLIFRTCYQSELFEFMTNEPRRPAPKTIEDLTMRNYTLYLSENYKIDILEHLIRDEDLRW